MPEDALLVQGLIPPVRTPWGLHCVSSRGSEFQTSCARRQNVSSFGTLSVAKALKKEEGGKTWKASYTFCKTKKKIISSFFNHYPNLLQTHRPYSIPIKLYRASPALDCQRGPSFLIYRPRKHSTIMVINNNRIQYMTTWMMEPLRIHLHCFVLQSSCL